MGPEPPFGTRTYRFKVYTLNTVPNLKSEKQRE